ncbi:MAG TPA: hypothetical protein VE909_08395 [Xanthobacteraceae bacterium]|nr:hypothetical protein [Xanthobacteraceae bacterium]
MAHPISDRVRDALFMVALFGSVGVACAQAPAPNSDKAAQPKDQPAQPPRVPGAEGVEEPSAKQAPTQAPTPPAGVFVNGSLAVPGAPNDTSTTPSRFSEKNDRLDQIPIMARGPQLTDEQRKLILDRVTSNDTGPPAAISAGPSTMLPSSIPMQAWPADVASAIPDIRDTKYVKLPHKILVVRPENWTVVEEIAR